MGTREFRVVFRERPNESDTDLKECESVVKRWWRVHVVKDSKLGELRRVGTQQIGDEDIGFSRVLIDAHVATVTQDAKKAQEPH